MHDNIINRCENITGAATAASTSYGTGFYGSAFNNYDTMSSAATSRDSWQTQGNLQSSNGNIIVKTNQDLLQEGTNLYATAGTLAYDIAHDLTIKASRDSFQSEFKLLPDYSADLREVKPKEGISDTEFGYNLIRNTNNYINNNKDGMRYNDDIAYKAIPDQNCSTGANCHVFSNSLLLYSGVDINSKNEASFGSNFGRGNVLPLYYYESSGLKNKMQYDTRVDGGSIYKPTDTLIKDKIDIKVLRK